ncbi:unnamed protein product [Pedinophyceae sp. YPF-701]|nr:unnamed protein product [Pedinophyceae sp. YPF-701]
MFGQFSGFDTVQTVLPEVARETFITALSTGVAIGIRPGQELLSQSPAGAFQRIRDVHVRTCPVQPPTNADAGTPESLRTYQRFVECCGLLLRAHLDRARPLWNIEAERWVLNHAPRTVLERSDTSTHDLARSARSAAGSVGSKPFVAQAFGPASLIWQPHQPNVMLVLPFAAPPDCGPETVAMYAGRARWPRDVEEFTDSLLAATRDNNLFGAILDATGSEPWNRAASLNVLYGSPAEKIAPDGTRKLEFPEPADGGDVTVFVAVGADKWSMVLASVFGTPPAGIAAWQQVVSCESSAVPSPSTGVAWGPADLFWDQRPTGRARDRRLASQIRVAGRSKRGGGAPERGGRFDGPQ